MNLHEYQAKQLFARYGVPTSRGEVATTPAQAAAAADRLGGELWVVKAQVHAGGRGKAGGVKLARSAEEVRDAAAGMLGSRLVTKQTGAEGLPINQVFVESGSSIERELYLSMLVDRGRERISFMASQDGGMDIEEVAEKTPERILTVAVHPAAGLQPYQARQLGFGLGLDANQIKQFISIVGSLYTMFVESDASLVEINPLIVDGDGKLLALDAKINIEDNALFRQSRPAGAICVIRASGGRAMERRAHGARPELRLTRRQYCLHGQWRRSRDGDDGPDQAARRRSGQFSRCRRRCDGRARHRGLQDHSFEPENVQAILVNIFGGIVRCDVIAEGHHRGGANEVDVKVPVVVQTGRAPTSTQGKELLANSGLDDCCPRRG